MRLQNIDNKIHHILNRIEEIDISINNNDELSQSERQSKELSIQLAEKQNVLRQAEFNVKDQQIKIAQTESSLYGGKIRNPKELQDLQHEVAALKRYLNVLEDRQIEAMISLEEAEENYNLATKSLDENKTKKFQQNDILSAEHTQLDLDLNHLYTERQAAVQTIDMNDLDIYEKLRSNRRGVAVSKIVDHSCSACGTTLSPATRQSAQSPTQIIQCPSCRRILYSG